MEGNLQKLLGLSDNKMKVLIENSIITPRNIVDYPNQELQNILNMSADAIRVIKERIVLHLSAEFSVGSDFFRDRRFLGETFPTGINQFDDLFANNGIFSGDIIEVIGPPAAGKTMLLYSIIINVLLEADEGFKIIFIDTKSDFRAMKLKNMMEARGVPDKRQRSILEAVTVLKCKTAEELVIDLQLIHCRPMSHSGVKMVFIDSITVPFYHFFVNTTFTMSLLQEVVHSLKLIAELNIAVIVTNLSLNLMKNRNHSPESLTPDEEADEEPASAPEKEGEPTMPEVYPALGKCWQSVAQHKVLVNFTSYPYVLANDTKGADRRISLFYSKSAATTKPTGIKITDQGIF